MRPPLKREHEITLWGAVTFAALLTAFSALRPVRDALPLDGNPEDIPWLFTGTFVVSVIASPLWSRLLANRPKRRVIPIAFHVFAACALAFGYVVHAGIEPKAMGHVFYVWSSVFNILVVSVFWSLLVDLLGTETAKRLYGPIAAGGTVGSFLGPLLTKALVEHIGVEGVVVISALLLELAVVGVWRVRIAGEALPHAPPDEPAHADALTGAKHVARSPYLLAIVGYVLCTATAATFLYLEQASIVKAAFADRVARTEFFATLDLAIAITTFVLQTLVASPLLRWVGPGIVLMVLPIAQGVGISAVVFAPSITALFIAQLASRSATHGLTRPARELLFTVVDREDKYHAKNLVDLAGYRFGDFAASWVSKGLVAVGGTTAVGIAAGPIVAVWLALAVVLGIGFRRRTS